MRPPSKRQQSETALIEAIKAERHYYADGVQYVPEFKEVLFFDDPIAKRDASGAWGFCIREADPADQQVVRQMIGAVAREFDRVKCVRVQDGRQYYNGHPIKLGRWFSRNGTK
jgi:hypothetical protein